MNIEDELPFRKCVLYTALVRDKQGRKMSKSLGNSPDPIKAHGATYGADGVRVGMLIVESAPQGTIYRSTSRYANQGKAFANKIWNAYQINRWLGRSKILSQPESC